MADQHGRYFFIDTKPSEEVISVPAQSHHHEEDYESDQIDEEIEHRLYSLIHHYFDELADPKSDEVTADQQPEEFNSPNNSPGNKGKAVKRNEDGDLRVTCDSLLLNLNTINTTKRKGKGSSNSPTPKKVKQSTNPNTPSKSPSKSNLEVNQRTPSIIYLSDSDEDTTTEEGTGVEAVKRDLWHIDYKDILISHPISGKFYRPRIWCSRCRKEGNHPVKLCHLPKHKICYICGNVGHLGQHCQNQHCKRCMDFHPTSICPLNVREIKCRICNKYGHLDNACPNHWRKFHGITDPQVDPDTNTTQIERNTKKSCSICGRHQHYSFECDRLRNRAIEISSPYDINTTIGSKFTPSRKAKPTSPQNIFRLPPPHARGTLPITTKFYGRRSRYFTGEPDQPQIDLTIDDEHTTTNTDSVVPSISPQQPKNNKSPKKKQKRRRKNNKQSKQQPNNIEVITTRGGPVLSGKVKKAKTRQQIKKAKKKSYKMRQIMRQQAIKGEPNRPNPFAFNFVNPFNL